MSNNPFLSSLKEVTISAVALSNPLFITTTPPNADSGSASIALCKASAGVDPKAIPQG